MNEDPRLVARSETHTGTRRVRPDSARPEENPGRGIAPRLDVDELLRARDAELALPQRWRVRLDHDQLWWNDPSGYTPHASNAKKWESRWDAYNAMQQEYMPGRRWSIEPVPRPHTLAVKSLDVV